MGNALLHLRTLMNAETRIQELPRELPSALEPEAVRKPLVVAGSFACISGRQRSKPGLSFITSCVRGCSAAGQGPLPGHVTAGIA